MYKKMFDLINNELNFLHDKRLELKKIEIKGIKIKLVFLDRQLMEVKTVLYEMDLFSTEPRLKFKKNYLKPFKDKYFR